MHAHISKKTLNDALSMLERIVPTRSSNPLLTSIKVDASERGLTFSGTNLEIDLSCFAAAEVTDPQSFVVPAHLFAQIVRNLGGELVELNLEGPQLVVLASGSDFKLQTGDLSAYPELTFPTGSMVTLDSAELARSLSGVRYAASNEAFQAVFRGLKVEQHPDKLRVVASDGFRLALRDYAVQGEERSMIIPARSCDEIVKVLRDGEVGLSFSDGLLGLTTARARMNVKLLDGDFPDYARVIPKDIKLRITLPTALLSEAVSRVAVLADKNANNRIELQISEGTLRLSSEGDYGRGQDTLSVTQEGSENAMNVAFNAKYLLDALGPTSGNVTLSLSGSTSPASFTSSGDQGYLAVVVPLRV